jgi:YbbR domain-containing protein
LFHEWRLKLASLGIAVLLVCWRSNEANPVEERRITGVPVKPVELAKGLQLVTRPGPVTITLKGQRRLLDGLIQSHRLQPTLNCRGITQPTLRSLAVDLDLPSGLEKREIEPAEFLVEFDEYGAESKPIRAEVGESAPAPGFGNRPPELAHNSAEVSGPRKLVRRVAYLAAVIDLSGLKADAADEARVTPVDADGQPVAGVECHPRTVAYKVAIFAEAGARPTPVKVQLTGTPAAGRQVVAVRCEPAMVVLSGDAAALAKVVDGVPTAAVEIAGKKSSFEGRVGLALPSGVTARPETVTVTVTLRMAHKWAR